MTDAAVQAEYRALVRENNRRNHGRTAERRRREYEEAERRRRAENAAAWRALIPSMPTSAGTSMFEGTRLPPASSSETSTRLRWTDAVFASLRGRGT